MGERKGRGRERERENRLIQSWEGGGIVAFIHYYFVKPFN